MECAEKAVTHWREFPLVEPRPLVLLSSAVTSRMGFDTVEASDGLRYGRFEADPSVPEEPLRTISALAADVSERRRPLPPLQIRRAIFTRAAFSTDRGVVNLPAWELDAIGARGPFWVMADETLARCWSPPEASEGELCGLSMLHKASVGKDDAHLSVEFVGSPSDLVSYETAVFESETAFTVIPVERSARHSPSGVMTTAMGMTRTVEVSLERDVGARVFVNLSGLPLPVIR